MDERIIMMIGGGLFLLQWAVFAAVSHRRKRELDRLTEYLMKVQDRRTLPPPEDCGEGRIGILESEIYKLLIQMKEQTDHSRHGQEYLAKMMSDIAHQLKTPLTSIGIMADLLKTPDIPEEKRIRYAVNIERQTERMTWFVKSLLTLSRLDANMIRLKKEQVNLRELFQTVIEPFEIMAELKGIEIELAMDSRICLECDRSWTGEAFSNILKNSLEHTDEGGRVWITGEKNNFSTNIYIRDNGSGIAPEDLGHIFERFYKGKHSSEHSVGIGLALSKQLILQQNGVISVKSEEGAGTQFHIKMYSDVNI